MKDILIDHFKNEGFSLVDNGLYNQLTIRPDIIFEKDDIIKVVVIRESENSLPDVIIQRFSESKRIPSKILEIYFSFKSKPTLEILRSCKLFGVGILYLNGTNEVKIYAESKRIKGRKNIIGIPKTQIFFSSRQNLPERREGESIINDQRESLKIPIFAMLVENDQQYSNDIRKLWKIIERCMDDCEYVLVILSGEYRKIIDRETRRALDYYDPEEILFYVKSDKETKDQWGELLLFATSQGVKYTEFIDQRDFRLKFNARLMRVIKRIHEINKIPFLEEGV